MEVNLMESIVKLYSDKPGEISSFLNKFFNNKLIIILISSIIFGLLHFSSIEFILITFFAGILLNYNFTLYYPKYKIAIIITALVHIISNFIVYNFDLFSNGSFS